MSDASKACQQQVKHVSSTQKRTSARDVMSAASKACQQQASQACQQQQVKHVSGKQKSILTTSKEAFFVFSPSSASTAT
jgi:hypothetical protein